MGTKHIRLPRNFVLEDRLARAEAAIEQRPELLRGRWAHACWPLCDFSDSAGSGGFRSVRLDLGCGKGAYLVDSALREPDCLFVGMDTEPVCIAYAAQRIIDSGLRNVVVIPRGARSVGAVFAEGELSLITINFPTPYPRSRDAHLRLTSIDHLLACRMTLAPGGSVELRTDSRPLWDFSLTQIPAAGFSLQWVSYDVNAEHPELISTEYERRLVARGATILGLRARLDAEPCAEQLEAGRRARRGLMSYLPKDLSTLGYMPLGMEAAIVNLRNRRLKHGA